MTIARWLTAGVLAFGLLGAPASAASAVPVDSTSSISPVLESEVGTFAFDDCPPGYGCLFMRQLGQGSRWDIPGCGVLYSFNTVGLSWLNNNTESVRNRGGGTIHLYDDFFGATGLADIRNNGVGVTLHPSKRNKTGSVYVDC